MKFGIKSSASHKEWPQFQHSMLLKYFQIDSPAQSVQVTES